MLLAHSRALVATSLSFPENITLSALRALTVNKKKFYYEITEPTEPRFVLRLGIVPQQRDDAGRLLCQA